MTNVSLCYTPPAIHDDSILHSSAERELLSIILRLVFTFCYVPDCTQNVASACYRACGWNQQASCIYLFQHYAFGFPLALLFVFGVLRSLVLVWFAMAMDVFVGLGLTMWVLVFWIDFDGEALKATERLEREGSAVGG